MNDEFVAFSQPQKLIRCRVLNQQNLSSLRYVELEDFQLWRYMMHNKHKLTVQDEQLCVWVSNQEFKSKEDLYLRAGHAVPVVRLVVMIYDEVSSYCHTIQRYSPEDDAENLRRILLSYVPEAARLEDRCESHWIDGVCIDRGTLGSQTELILGLGVDSVHRG